MANEEFEALLRQHLAPILARVDGLPLIAEAVKVLQRDVRKLRDDMTVLTGIAIRLEGTAMGLVEEIRGMRGQIGDLRERVDALEGIQR